MDDAKGRLDFKPDLDEWKSAHANWRNLGETARAVKGLRGMGRSERLNESDDTHSTTINLR